jgi:ATP-dependent helicase/nuclease subunit B
MHLAPMMQAVLARGGMLVTANARATRGLTLAHAEVQRAAGLEVWPTPAIQDWESWLDQLWNEHLFGAAAKSPPTTQLPMMLSSLQERAVWRRVIQRAGDADRLLSPDGMAALAQSAYALLSRYERHATRNSAWHAQSDAESFRGWAAQFDRDCGRNAWASRSAMEGMLRDAIRSGTLAPPGEILLIGFDRLTPAQESLIRACRERGSAIERSASEPANEAELKLVGADDARDEITTCAWWARNLLASQQGIRIGVLAPDVSALRGDFERIFLRVLAPQSAVITSAATSLPFEFSLGQPLDGVPLVRAALLLLRWLASPLLEEEVTWLALSGFLAAGEQEYLSLADFDCRRRNSGALSPEITLGGFLSASEFKAGAPARQFLGRLREVQRTADASELSTRVRSHSDWVALVTLLLTKSAWPGSRTLPSIEFQARDRWERMLDEIATLDFEGSRVPYDDFLSTLQRRANDVIFAQRSHDAPVQISGAFEASGQTFDAVWFLGADDDQWPASARAHPLLPPAVQREAEMPHASPGVDWQLARTITHRIAASAPLCVFSYARQNAYGELRPSPLLREIFSADRAPESSLSLQTDLGADREPHRAVALEEIDDDSGMLPWNAALNAGGSDMLKMQAACPFQAFASKRLRAEPLNRTEWGLSAPERGNLLHTVLEQLWSPHTPEPWGLRTLEDLLRAQADNRLESLLEHHTSAAFAPLLAMHAGDPWMNTYLKSEQQQLCVHLSEWLAVEAGRQPFTVEHAEQRLDGVNVGGLRLRLRADRIDLLPNGSRLIIDYKTGSVSAAQWSGARPDEPQLPLYATYGGVDEVRGILFAQIRAGDTRFIGRVHDAQSSLSADLKGTSGLLRDPYTQELRDEWDATLQALAAQFLAGDASVDPKRPGVTCEHCSLPGLCRIAESDFLSQIDEDSGEISSDDGAANG